MTLQSRISIIKPIKKFFLTDWDQTVVNAKTSFRDFFNQHYGINSTSEDYYSNDFPTIIRKYNKDIKVTNSDIVVELSKHYYTDKFHNVIEPNDPYVVEVIKALSKDREGVIVTARSETSEQMMQSMISKFFPDCLDSRHYVNKWKAGKIIRAEKFEIVLALGPENFEFYIDDSPEEILTMQKMIPSLRSILYDPRGINRNIPGIKESVWSWKEIGDEFVLLNQN